MYYIILYYTVYFGNVNIYCKNYLRGVFAVEHLNKEVVNFVEVDIMNLWQNFKNQAFSCV